MIYLLMITINQTPLRALIHRPFLVMAKNQAEEKKGKKRKAEEVEEAVQAEEMITESSDSEEDAQPDSVVENSDPGSEQQPQEKVLDSRFLQLIRRNRTYSPVEIDLGIIIWKCLLLNLEMI
jgi:hypothetical protein